MKPILLILEDDDGLRDALARSVARRGFHVTAVDRVAAAVDMLRTQDVDIVLADMRLPDGSGREVLDVAVDVDPEIRVVMMTAFPEVQTAVDAMKQGAHDFIVKPFELEEIHVVLSRAQEAKSLRQNLRRLMRDRPGVAAVTDILGSSDPIESVRAQILQVAPAAAPVLVVGETGTGKELVADAIHRASDRHAGPLVKVNCAAIPASLLENELFGHDKGAFTGAGEAREGLFEMADEGTLFLDEIGEMHPDLQARLLRVVEGKPFHRVGGRREIRTDVRIVAATHRDLKDATRDGTFREDLYFRLDVFRIDVPPLRDRGHDVCELARRMVPELAAPARRPAERLSPDVERLLLEYRWPGNIRELRNVLERAVILCPSRELGVEHVPAELRAPAERPPNDPAGGSSLDEYPTLKEMEERYVRDVLEACDGNISQAARVLGVARNTLKSRLR